MEKTNQQTRLLRVFSARVIVGTEYAVYVEAYSEQEAKVKLERMDFENHINASKMEVTRQVLEIDEAFLKAVEPEEGDTHAKLREDLAAAGDTIPTHEGPQLSEEELDGALVVRVAEDFSIGEGFDEKLALKDGRVVHVYSIDLDYC